MPNETDRKEFLSAAVLALVAALLSACGGTEATSGNSGTGGASADTGGTIDTGAGDTGGGSDVAPDDTGDPDAVSPDGNDASDDDSAARGDSATAEDGGETTVDCPGAAGCACAGNADCDNGVCLDTPDGKQCATNCIDNCADKGYTCQNIGTADVLYVCVSDFISLCSPCESTKDCGPAGSPAICLDYGDAGKFCGGPCKADDDCPDAGYACVEVLHPDNGKLTKQCKRKDVEGKPGLCSCSVWAKAAALKTSCKVTNDAGSCSGQRQCTADGMSACSAKTPVEETCNGIDDDCNGATDILPASKTCNKSAWLPLGSGTTCASDGDCTAPGESCNPGKGVCQTLIGTCKGTATCSGGAEVCSDVKTPKTEACNGEDDDCDGNADEDFGWKDPLTAATVPVGGGCGLGPCKGGVVACETLLAAVCTSEGKNKAANDTCNGEDDDCDGVTDDGACEDGDACTADVCDAAAKKCSNDGVVNCDDSNACTSDACDSNSGGCVHKALTGSCDDGNACTAGDACVADAQVVALCLPGKTTKDCDDANPCTDDSCDATKGCVQLANAVTMACYDGAAATQGVGTCTGGVRACSGGKLGETCVGQVAPNKTELCDGKDDTCDGVTDEGCKASTVAGGFAAASAVVTGAATAKAPGLRVVVADGSVGAGAASAPGGKTLHAGFIAWWLSLWE